MLDKRAINLLDNAYKKLKSSMAEDPQKYELAENTYKNFITEIADWDDSKSLDFIEKYYLSDGSDRIADIGQGKCECKSFMVFMGDPKIQPVIKRMFKLRKHESLLRNLWLELDKYENSLDKHLDRYKFKQTGKPWAITHRFTIMTFLEISTTIADKPQLRKTAEILTNKVIPLNTSFEILQMQARKIVDEYLNFRGVYGLESKIFKAMLAWYVLK